MSAGRRIPSLRWSVRNKISATSSRDYQRGQRHIRIGMLYLQMNTFAVADARWGFNPDDLLDGPESFWQNCKYSVYSFGSQSLLTSFFGANIISKHC
jgi:hypothetical protein